MNDHEIAESSHELPTKPDLDICWTRTPPTEPGTYFVSSPNDGRRGFPDGPRVYEVELDARGRLVLVISGMRFGVVHLHDVAWFGPIAKPAAPIWVGFPRYETIKLGTGGYAKNAGGL